ncbi:MAG: hypothetical protein ACKVP1_18735 [Burkholderiaceae bacterium]
MPKATTRLEHDLLGDRKIPAGAYWGVDTLCAAEHFRARRFGEKPVEVLRLAR